MPYIGNITQDFNVSNAMLDTDSVTSIKIVDGTIEGADIAANLDLSDSQKIRFGAGNDLQIYHDGSDSFIKDAGTGSLTLNSNLIALNNTGQTENMLTTHENDAVKLYYDNSKKLETTSTGVSITGAITSTGSLTVSNTTPQIFLTDTNANSDYKLLVENGTFHIADVTNGENRFRLESDGDFDLKGNVRIPLDDKKLQLGASQDLEIYHDGTNSNIKNNTNQLNLLGNDIRLLNNIAGEAFLKAFNNGAVELYYDASKKFETTSAGALITGKLETTGLTRDGDITFERSGNTRLTVDNGGITVGGDIKYNDNYKIKAGTGADLEIYHNGNHSKIRDVGTGNLYIESVDGNIYLRVNDNEQGVTLVENGAVELYHDNSKKFETTSYGNASAGQVRVTSSNASTVAFSCGDVGTGLYNAGGNTIGYSVNGTEKLRIDSSGRLLHGVTASVDVASTASAQTQIHSSNSTVQFAIAGYGNNAGGSIFALGHSRSGTVGNATGQLSNNDEIGTIRFAPSDGTDMENTAAAISGIVDGNVSSNSTPGAVIFYTNNGSGQTEKLRIRAAGGITFNGDTAAANALDDYEEGTFTPVLNNAGSFSVNNHTGTYTKVGRLVHYIIQISGTCTGTGSGTFTVSGLPFNANNSTGGHGQAGCMGALFRWNIPDTAYQIGIRVSDNSANIQFFANFDNANDAQLTSPFNAGTIFGSLAGSYFTT